MSAECIQLHSLIEDLPVYCGEELKNKDARNNLVPSDGIYFVLEKGEFYRDKPRIVRIGFNRRKGTLPNKVEKILWGNSSFRKYLKGAIIKKYKNLDNLEYYINKNIYLTFIPISSFRVRRRIVRRVLCCLEDSEYYEASPQWLGKNSTKFSIRKRGFWHLKSFRGKIMKKLKSKDLEYLEKCVSGFLKMLDHKS